MIEEVIRDAFAVLLYYRNYAAKDGYRDDRTGKQTKRPRPSSASSGPPKWRDILAGAIYHGSSMVKCLQELMLTMLDDSDEDSKDRSFLETIRNYGSDDNSKDRNVLEKVMNYSDEVLRSANELGLASG